MITAIRTAIVHATFTDADFYTIEFVSSTGDVSASGFYATREQADAQAAWLRDVYGVPA